jgi:hypothetical protein
MAATEELRVEIKTVADTKAVKEATATVNEFSQASRKARGGAADVAADVQQQRIRAAGGLEAFLRQQEQQQARAATTPGGGGAAGGRGAAAGGVGNVLRDVTRLAGISTGLYAVHRLLQDFNRYLSDSIQLLRDFTHATGGFSTQVNALDAAFTKASRSGDALQITLGRMAAPGTVGQLKAQAEGADFLNEKLTGLARFIQQHTSGPSLGDQFLNKFVGGAEFLPVVGEGIREVAELGKTLEEVDRDQQRRVANRQNARLLEINDLPRRDTASELARLAFWDQVDAAVREVTSAQQAQIDLQHEGVNLAAQEAQIRLGMLPTAERLAEVQRDATEAQIRARQAALPASEALEDLQYEQQRARLIAMNRGAGVEARTAARRQLRSLARAEPGVALGALEAGRPVTLAGRAVERVGLEQQLFQITNERALAQITLAQETNGLLAQIAEQRTQAIELTINMGSEQFRTEFHAALQVVEAKKPAPIPLVGTNPS